MLRQFYFYPDLRVNALILRAPAAGWFIPEHSLAQVRLDKKEDIPTLALQYTNKWILKAAWIDSREQDNMEAVIFCGIQASGKTTFYVDHFLKTHIRISLDQLHTRNKEMKLLQFCLDMQQRFVVDNTNPTRKERAKYIEAAKHFKFKVIGYFFHTGVSTAIARNSQRKGKECISIPGIWGTFKKLEAPLYEEGFDQLFKVEMTNSGFAVNKIITFPNNH
jgi:predicted kinase